MTAGSTTQLPDLLRVAVGVAPVAMLVADGGGRLIAANSVWVGFAGDYEEWTGLFEPESRQRMEQYLADVVAGRPAPPTIDAEMLTRAGRHWTRWWARRETLADEVVVTLVVIDTHDEVSRVQDLREQATHDHMTGLLNRRFFMESVAQAQRRASRSGTLQALLYVDLDHFKSVNDSGGHAVGDEVLALVAHRLQTAIRGADMCARLGGDEFAILLEGVSGPDYAHTVAGRVADSLAAPVEVAGRRWPITASVGVAMASGTEESPEAWLHRADAAMYAEKRRRRGSSTAEPRPAGPPTANGPSGGGASYPTPADDAALERLRSLRDDLLRVSRSLDEFDAKLRA